jgi:glycosyltransferase involved in cell wall biosynthesis
MHKRPVKQFWVYQRKIAFIISAILASIWYLSIPFLQDFFRASSQLPLLLFTPVLLIGLVASVDSGFLSGNLKFKILSIVLFVEPLSKLAITFLLIALNLGSWVVAAVPTSLLISFAVGWFLISRIPYPDINLNEIDIRHFPKRFMTGAILNKVSLVLYMNMDILLAKHFFSPTDAGLYSFVSLAGKMVHYSSNIFAQFINPLVAHAEGAGKNSSKTFSMLLIPIIISSVFSYLLIGVFGNFTVPLLFGDKTLPIIKYLPFYALSIAAFSIASSISAYQLARRKYIYPIINFAIMAGQILVVFLYHDSISQFITIMVISGISNLLCIVSTNLYLSIKSRYRKESEQAYPSKKLRILIYNWRDTKHKWRGGAEVYIHELAKRWVKNGHSVTLFCGNDRLQPRNELIDGVQVIRRGGTFLVYFWAFIYYQFVFKGSYDVIIDSENGIPFFTPLYAKEKVYLLIHHVHQEVFRKSLHPPLSWIGILLERRIMPLVYRNIAIVTVSPSSKMDILEHKLTTKDPHIIYNGVDLNLCTPGKKHKEPTVLYLGRLTSLKSISVLIHSAKQILEVIPKVRFIIAGDGPDLTNLTKLVKKLHLENNIQFIGTVTEEEKIRLYQEAWVFVNPSLIEGWGITTIEANACGTPVVASNVAGLRDAVHNPHSGFLVPYGDVNEFTNTTLNLLTHRKLRQTMSAEAISWAKMYDWEKSATIFETLIEPKYRATSDSVESRPYDTVKLLAAALLNTLIIRSKLKQTDNITFPNKVGVYTFYKNLEKIGPKNSYAIGLYKDPHGQFVFAKMRSASTHDYHYLSLRNEINIYEILTRVRERIDSILPKKFSNIEIPNLLHVHEDSNHLIMFLKYHKGKPLVTSKNADKTDIFILCSKYLTYLENHMTQQDRQRVSQRSPIHLLYLLPFISARTVMNHPTLWYSILQAWFYIILNYKTVTTSWEASLVHRDLHFRNILIDGNKIAIIDLQQCVITEKLQEYVTILRYYWETDTEYATLHNSLMNSYVDVPTFTNRVRWLALHSAIHGLTDNSFPKDMKQRWKNFLNYTLQKNSFTKEISI